MRQSARRSGFRAIRISAFFLRRHMARRRQRHGIAIIPDARQYELFICDRSIINQIHKKQGNADMRPESQRLKGE